MPIPPHRHPDRAEPLDGTAGLPTTDRRLPPAPARPGQDWLPAPRRRSIFDRLWPFTRGSLPEGLQQARLYLMARFRGDGQGDRPRVVLLTANGRREGVTTIAAGLAEAFGDDLEGKVLLIDPHPANSRLKKRLRAQQIYPAETVEVGQGADEERTPTAVLLRSAHRKFDVLQIMKSIGTTESAFRKYAVSIYPLYDVVIVDAGSLKADIAYRTKDLADSTLLVVDARRTTVQMLERVKKTLAARNFDVDGIILNRRRSYVPKVFGGHA